MKLRRRCMQTLGVSVKQLRRKLLELGARILHFQATRPHDMALVMLSVSAGMEVGSGGHGGLGGGLVETGTNGAGGGGGGDGGGGGGVGVHGTDGMHEAMVAAARDRAVRAGSVRHDLALDLPPRLHLPDGEEKPYGAATTLHLRDPAQESEIYQKCVRPPPNRTVFDSESPPPYRSHSALLDQPDRIVRCHSAGSSLLRVFRKFPSSSSTTGTTTTMTATTTTTMMTATTTTTTTTTTPAMTTTTTTSAPAAALTSAITTTVVAPATLGRPTLSSYSESSGNLSNLSSLTIVPCEADETNRHKQHV